MSKNKEDYKIGYKKPPKASRFKPGKSGNPAGRPKGSRNMSTMVEEELDRHIEIRENSVKQKITKRLAIVRGLVNRALNQDHRALLALLKLQPETPDQLTDEDVKTKPISAEDKAILQDFVERTLHTKEDDQQADSKGNGK